MLLNQIDLNEIISPVKYKKVKSITCIDSCLKPNFVHAGRHLGSGAHWYSFWDSIKKNLYKKSFTWASACQLGKLQRNFINYYPGQLSAALNLNILKSDVLKTICSTFFRLFLVAMKNSAFTVDGSLDIFGNVQVLMRRYPVRRFSVIKPRKKSRGFFLCWNLGTVVNPYSFHKNDD